MATQSASVEIALKPSVGKTLPNNIQAIIQNEYASRYLESIGANPSRENMDLMLKSLPLKEALILPVWQREAIVIMPGVAKNADINAIMHQLVNSNLEKARGETDAAGKGAAAGTGAGNNEEDGDKKKHTKKVTLSHKNKVNIKDSVDITHPKKENHNRDSRKLSWCTVNTLDVLDDYVDVINIQDAATNHFKNLLLPMGLVKNEIMQSVRCFNLSLDGFLLENNLNNKKTLELSIQSLLESNICLRLYDILIRFCYWNIVHPTARKIIISAKNADSSLFPEPIATTANAKRESLAYLIQEINLKRKKEQELLAAQEEHDNKQDNGTGTGSGRERLDSSQELDDLPPDLTQSGVGSGTMGTMESVVEIGENGFGPGGDLDQPHSAISRVVSNSLGDFD